MEYSTVYHHPLVLRESNGKIPIMVGVCSTWLQADLPTISIYVNKPHYNGKFLLTQSVVSSGLCTKEEGSIVSRVHNVLLILYTVLCSFLYGLLVLHYAINPHCKPY